MNTKFWLNLGLLIAVLALAGVAFFEPGKEEPKTVHLTDLDTETVSHIELQNKETLVFDKREGRWWLTRPFTAPANDIRVHQLLEIARADSEAQYPLKSEERAKFELDKPKARLTIAGTQLIFGGSDPLDMRRYVQIGETLNLVNDDFFHHLIAAPTDFIDKKLLPNDDAPNEILVPGVKATLAGDGHWVVEPPSDADAGVPDLVGAWLGARAIDIKRYEQPLQGDLVRIGYKDKPAVEFVIVQREPELILARNDWGLQYILTGESGKPLLTLLKPNPNAEDTEEDESLDENANEMDMPAEDDDAELPADGEDEDENSPHSAEDD